MTDIATLTGWGHPHDALAAIAPDARHIDYAQLTDWDAALTHAADAAQNAQIVIGWSLGGFIAAHLIAERLIRPEKLVLISAPFQFVASASVPAGMGRQTFDQFRDNYRISSERTLKKSYQLIMKDDKHASHIATHLNTSKERLADHDWLFWLNQLEARSCEGLDFSHFPHTILIHGSHDAVTSSDQAQLFATRLPNATTHIIEDCGHAPHWHDTARVKGLI